MARNVLTYTTTNSLGDKLINLHGRRIAERGGIKVNLSDVEKELADFCGIGIDSIGMIKRGNNQPSLPVAMKMAIFFDCKVEDIFTYKDIVCTACHTHWDGTQTERISKSVLKAKCQNCGSVID